MPDRSGAALTSAVTVAWRVSNYRTLDGEGGMRASGRWHTKGRHIVYLAESPAGALVEVLVHLELDPAALPKNYTLLKVAIPADVPVKIAEPRASTLDVSREVGDRWLNQRESALLRVPSGILPETFNLLLNPAHPDAARIRTGALRALGLSGALLI